MGPTQDSHRRAVFVKDCDEARLLRQLWCMVGSQRERPNVPHDVEADAQRDAILWWGGQDVTTPQPNHVQTMAICWLQSWPLGCLVTR
jgi:hypothetical protein